MDVMDAPRADVENPLAEDINGKGGLRLGEISGQSNLGIDDSADSGDLEFLEITWDDGGESFTQLDESKPEDHKSMEELLGTKETKGFLGMRGQNRLFTAPVGGLKPKELELCKQAFMVMDMNEDGQVGLEELRTVIQVLGGRPTEEEMQQIMLSFAGEDNMLDVQEFIKLVEQGKMDIADHGSAINVPHLLAIRDSYIKADQDRSGYINWGEFHAMTMAMPVKVRGHHLARIWKMMAMKTHDWSIELVCWIDDYPAWDEDPRRKDKFAAECEQAVATFVDVDVARVHVASVLKGEKTRLQTVKNLHDKAVSIDANQIATVTIVVDTVYVERLRTAAIVGDVEKVKVELAKKVDPNMPDETGKTCLHVAAVEGHEAVVLALLQGGTDHTIQDKDGRTALDLGRMTNVDGITDNDRVIAQLEKVEGTIPNTREYVRDVLAKPAIEKFRDSVRMQLKREAEMKGAKAALKGELQGMTIPGMDENKFRIRKFLHADAEMQISWKGFVNGMALLANTKLGALINVQEVARLDSILLKKAISEEEHMRELNHPSVSPMERLGVKFLSDLSRASYFDARAAKAEADSNSREKQMDDDFKTVTVSEEKSQAELDFNALDQTLTLSGIEQGSGSGLQGLHDYKNHNREKSQKVIDWCVWRCALAGAFAALLCAIGDVLQVLWFQGDAELDCRDRSQAHHNICPACLGPDDKTLPDMQGVCPDLTNATGYADLEHRCCAMLCGDSGAEATLFGFGTYEGGHTVDEAAGYCNGDHGDATIELCYVPDCVEQKLSIAGTLAIVLPFTIISSSVEIGWLYYDTLKTCMQMSHAVGLVLWPLDKERIRIGTNLVKAAFELDDPDDIQYGINPLKEVNSVFRTFCSLLYAGKTGMSKFVAKLLLKRLMSRVGVRRAADATLSSFVTVPIGFVWNGVVAKQCTHQARLRAVGTITAIECVDKILPIDKTRPEGTVSDQVAKLILRVIGCAIVAKRGMHPNVELLLRRVHERLIQLDVEVQGTDDDAAGWGAEGFPGVDDTEEMLTEWFKLTQADEMHSHLVFNVFLIVMMIDGKMSKHELKLLRRVLREGLMVTSKWDLFYEAGPDEQIFTVNGDKSKIQELFFKHAELLLCKAGDQLHAGHPLELEMHVEVVLPDLKMHHDQLLGRKPTAIHEESLSVEEVLMSSEEKDKFEEEQRLRETDRTKRELNSHIDRVTSLLAW